MPYQPGSDPVTASEAAEYIPQWGPYMNAGDPGYICYTAIPPEMPEHRDEMVRWLEGCRPLALEGCDEDGNEFEWSDPEMFDRVIEYLNGLTYPKMHKNKE